MTISAINLGNTFTNLNGQSVTSGLSSGLNTQSVINSIVAAQSSQITTLNDKVTVNNNQATALTTLQQLMTALQTAAEPLSDPQSPDSVNNLWTLNTSAITSNTSQAASNYLTATVASGSSSGNYTISNITQLATKTTQTTGTFGLTSPATGSVVADNAADAAASGKNMFAAGEITFTGGATVTLTTGETLNQVAAAFNNVTTTSGGVTGTGISANVLETAPGEYTLVFSSTATGAGSLFDLTNTAKSTASDPSSVLSNIGLQTMSAANEGQDASFELNGITITRPTNTVSDLISGVTLNLLQNTSTQPGASFNLQIAPDTASIATGIENFGTAYNNFLTFYAQQTALGTSGTPASSAVLYSDTTLQNIYNQVTSEASSLVAGIASGNYSQLSDVGISFTDTPATGTTPAVNNTLAIDTTTLQDSLTNNFSQVENLFGYNLTSSSPNLILFQSANNSSITHFTMNIDQTDSPPVYTATYIDTNGDPQTVDFTATALTTGGVTLTAPTGSELAGLQLIYGSTGSESGIAVTTTQGIAAQINNIATAAIAPSTGLIATDQAAVQTSVTTLQTQITTVTSQVASTRQSLLTKYSQLEEAISKANSTLNYLNAQQSAASSGG